MSRIQRRPYGDEVSAGFDLEEESASASLNSSSNGDSLAATVAAARQALHTLQAKDGHWLFELEADATISAEYILLEHFIGEIDAGLQAKIATYLKEIQGPHGGWPLFYGGEFNLSASVKTYYALKLAGEHPDAPHMRHARKTILEHGGAAHCNVFTRITLALFRQLPWTAAPIMPVEIMHLPEWFPFHLSKISYWSRAVLVPLLILQSEQAEAENPLDIGIDELFPKPPTERQHYLINPTGSPLGAAFLALDRALFALRAFAPKQWRQRATDKALAFIEERLNGEDGLGGIFPAMANSLMVFHSLGYPKDHPHYVSARTALQRLLVVKPERAYCQPCLSPVWDTALAAIALLEAGEHKDGPTITRTVQWLEDRQILKVHGDWEARRPNVRPGGWPFQFSNDYYPDTDDTSAVLIALRRAGLSMESESMRRGIEWIVGLQSRNGGWGAYDADNTHRHLNHIPFADHGALLDPPTADVTARCVQMLAECGYDRSDPAVARGLDFLLREQEKDGSWYGRWGTNYIYGTWSVLIAMQAAGDDPQAPHIRKAVSWLKSQQRHDGGWGEDCATYWPERRSEGKQSTPAQTAWALLGLMAAGEVHSEEVRLGIRYLLRSSRQRTEAEDAMYNAVGFPRVFYLKYHGYNTYFPLWALASYQNLSRGNGHAAASDA